MFTSTKHVRRLRAAVCGIAFGLLAAVVAPTAVASEHDGHDHHDMFAGCSDDHPATVEIVGEVEYALEHVYTDVPALLAQGYHPYFDGFFPGGYPPGGDGVQHYINPQYIDDGVQLDPMRPESVILDDWNRPFGMMFIADSWLDEPPAVYVNEDGTPCKPWHTHTDHPARFGWMWYRAVYDGAAQDGSLEYPDETPPMMHVWGIPNPNPGGRYAGMDYAPCESREGPPGPLPSFLRDSSVEETTDGLFDGNPHC